MRKEDKATLVDEIADRLGDAPTIFAVDYRGITVPQAAELRAKLAEADASFRVVKNRLAKRATERAGKAELDDLLVGPTALAFVKGDAVTAAKAISTFGRQHDILEYRGGIMDGAPLDPEQFRTIARLPGVEVLRGQLLGAVASPLTGLARGLGSMLSGLAVALGQVAEQGLVGGAEEPEPAEAATTEEPPAGEEPAEAGPQEDGGAENAAAEAADDEETAQEKQDVEDEAPANEEPQASREAETSEDATSDEAQSPDEPEAEANGSEGSDSEEDR
jgi:large subunit ribosomal protein L10